MHIVLETENLSKNYGKIQAVKNLNLTVEKGNIYGLLGPNGSGKSTTLGMLLRVVNPSSGSWKWLGSTNHEETIKQIGAIIESPKFYPYLSANQNLKLVADIKKVSYDTIIPALQLVDLEKRKDDLFKNYSLGMKQRLAIASAMLHNPEILILDEPTNGLDPEGIIQVRHIIQKIAKEGTTIIMASHLLDEVEKICSHVVILNKGSVLYNGSVKNMGKKEKTIELAAKDLKKLFQAMQESTFLKKIKMGKGKIVAEAAENIQAEELNKYFFEKDIILNHLIVKEANLESQFFHLLKEKTHA